MSKFAIQFLGGLIVSASSLDNFVPRNTLFRHRSSSKGLLLPAAILLGFLAFCNPALVHAQCPSQTPNLGLQIPNLGNVTTWGLCLNNDLATLDNILGGSNTLQVGTATPLINAAGPSSNFLTANTTSTAITNILGGYPGQTIHVICGPTDTFTSIVASANMAVNSTWSCPSSGTLTLTFVGMVWHEVSRQFPTGAGVCATFGIICVDGVTYTTLASAITACPSNGCTIIPTASLSMTSATIGTATQHINLILNPNVFLTATGGSFTVASGSSIHGSGSSSSGLICAINTSTPCLLTTRDYETQNYVNGTQLTDFSVECNGTGCSDGLQNPGLGIGWKISGLQIDQPYEACWHVNGSSSSDWTEGSSAGANIACLKPGADGFDWDVSSGGFFNDVTLTNSQVRSQKGYIIQATSGAFSAVSVNRIVLINFHGLSAGATQTVQDGFYCNNGGGSNSISGWVFQGGEIEGNSQSGYPINGSGANSCTGFSLDGTTENGWTSGISSANVGFAKWCNIVFVNPCEFGTPFGLLGPKLDRGMVIQPGDNWFAGGTNNLTAPPYSSTLGQFLHASAYLTPTTATSGNVSPITLLTAGSGLNGTSELMQFSGYVTLTAVGTSCSGTNTLVVTLTFTDPNAAGTQTLTQTFTFSNNGTLGQIGSIAPLTIQAKATTTVSLSTAYTPAGACSPPGTYKIYPDLELVN